VPTYFRAVPPSSIGVFRSFVFPTVVFRANILSRRPPFLARSAGEEGGQGGKVRGR